MWFSLTPTSTGSARESFIKKFKEITKVTQKHPHKTQAPTTPKDRSLTTTSKQEFSNSLKSKPGLQKTKVVHFKELSMTGYIYKCKAYLFVAIDIFSSY